MRSLVPTATRRADVDPSQSRTVDRASEICTRALANSPIYFCFRIPDLLTFSACTPLIVRAHLAAGLPLSDQYDTMAAILLRRSAAAATRATAVAQTARRSLSSARPTVRLPYKTRVCLTGRCADLPSAVAKQ